MRLAVAARRFGAASVGSLRSLRSMLSSQWRAMAKRSLVPSLLSTLLALPATGSAEEVVRHVGNVTFRVDVTQAFPGGVVVVRLSSRGRLGAAWALLDGRRAPFYSDGRGPRALVPVAVTTGAGPATLGVGVASRGGEQRIAIPITITSREYRPRHVFLTEPQRAFAVREDAQRDARRLLGQLRTESKSPAPGPLAPPVSGLGGGFGDPRTYTGVPDVEQRFDSLSSERHRGLDYLVPLQTPVHAPAAGNVLHAGALGLGGGCVVIDHGQGVVSVLQHLGAVSVREGDAVAAGAVVGLSGQSGLAPEPMLQWRVYLHAVAVDPLVLGLLL